MAVEPIVINGLVLVSGPSRSGKSRWAEHLAQASGRSVIYLATGPHRPDDVHWQQRLAEHRQRRPRDWQCREVGADLEETLEDLHGSPAAASTLLLIDSLGTWLAYHLDCDQAAWQQREQRLCQRLAETSSAVILVCEEVGWGVVPPTAVGGRFRDRLGRLQQLLMAQSQDAWLVLQGRALNLHQLAVPVP